MMKREALDKGSICPLLALSELHHALGNLRDAFGEFAGGAVPAIMVGLTPVEEELEDADEFVGFVDGAVEGDSAILE